MYHSRLFLLSLLVFLSGFTRQAPKPYLSKWVITKECSLKVGGSTNIDPFSCVIASYYRPDTLTFYQDQATSSLRISGGLVLDVNSFDCYNPVMTANLRKTLKAKAFPKLTIRFINLSRYPDYQDRAAPLKGAVTIELAGVTKRFEVDYRFIPDGRHALTLVGKKQVKFSDFHIVPPRKLGGMIQTDNKLDVTFSLKVKILN